jgi:hypothetical protein
MGVSVDSCKGERMGAVSLVLLVPDRQAVPVKIKDLDPIPATVEEEEEMAGQELLVEAFLDQAGKAVEALAEIDRSCAEEGPDGRGKHDHDEAS